MKLYIVRHGIAVDIGEQGVHTDAERMLSTQGRQRTRSVAKGLAVLGCTPQRILTSPLVRARETAEIIRDMLGAGALEVVEELKPGGSIRRALEHLAGTAVEEAMVVGHMPDMAAWVSLCLADHAMLDVAFKKAATCCLTFPGDVGPGQAALEWHLPPRVLRTLGEQLAPEDN